MSFAKTLPTHIESWPQPLVDLSVRHVGIKLTIPEANILGASLMEFGETFERPVDERNAQLVLADIEQRIDVALAKFPGGAVVRLGSRSPKDTMAWNRKRDDGTPGFKVKTGREGLELLRDASERVSDDLHAAIHFNHEPYIFVREWLTFEPWQEFRCFWRGRQLVGFSQYHYKERFEKLLQNADSIRRAVYTFLRPFKDAIHLEDCIFDVVVNVSGVGSRAAITPGPADAHMVTLLEINPWGPMTDPCMFDWSKPIAGEEFRFVR